MPVPDRIKARIRTIAITGCWEWTGCVQANGYGRIRINNRTLYAHRVSYEAFKGPIPERFDIDHLCRNTRCVNPDHLEAVTHRENGLRGEHPWARAHRSGFCSRGHPQPETGRYRGNGQCLACIPILSKRLTEKRSEKRRRMAA